MVYKNGNNSDFNLPANFRSEDVALYNHRNEIVKRSPDVREYENIKISSEGVLFRNNRIMNESFAHRDNFKQWKTGLVIKAYVQNFLLKKSRRLDSVVWVTDDWSEGYFHWLSDVLPKLV